MEDLNIEKVSNGYIMKFWNEIEGEPTMQSVVFEEQETQHGEVECFKNLLYSITEYFGMVGSKHDERRIKITTGGEDD